MGELVLIIVIVAAIAYAREDYKKSKGAYLQKQPATPRPKRSAALIHHDIGYWTYQVSHLFPAFRHGFAAAWHEERQKTAKARAERVKAKTEHMETVAALEPQIADHRQRQAAAREAVRAAREPGEGSGEGSPDMPPGGTLPGETTAAPAADPGRSQDPWTQLPAEPPVAGPAPSTEGEQAVATAGDTTYYQHKDTLTKMRDDAEDEVNSVRRKRMLNHLDTLMSLKLDNQSLEEAARIDEALKEQQKAAEEAHEAAETALAGLVKRHGGVQEAVDSAPISLPAEREFYAV